MSKITEVFKKLDIICIIMAIIFIIMSVFGITSRITQYEQQFRLRQLSEELSREVNVGKLNHIEYEKRTNYRTVENYVLTNLNMVKTNNYQIEYIVSNNTNQTLLIQTAEDDTNVFSQISRALSIAVEYFK